MEIGKPPWCCPRQAEFWRLCCTGWGAAYWKLVRLPGVAPGHPPWRGDILLFNHSRKGNKKAGGTPPPPPRAISTKNKHLLLSCDTNPRFHGGSFGVWGHTSCEALKMKIRPNSSGALVGDPWAEPTGGEPRLSRAFLCFVPGDIIKTSVAFYSQFFAFRYRVVVLLSRLRAIKNPAS